VADAADKPTAVTLDTVAYITLLVKANITDPALWPPGMQEGAAALARVREIERECITQHGEFDWEQLPEAVQDEYDSRCALLDRLQDTGERIPWEVYKARRQENQP
jgi:hypothetical protein